MHRNLRAGFPYEHGVLFAPDIPGPSVGFEYQPSMRTHYEEDWFDEPLRSDDEITTNFADEEDDETFNHAFSYGIGHFPIANLQNSDARWYSSSQTLEVHGYRINRMVYAGTRLAAVNGQGTEPALINPLLRVQKPTHSYSALDLPYWPSYTGLSPQARGKYLRWLAEGRKDPEIGIGFVFLFFYGLERRLLADECPAEERAELVAEIERLRTIYTADPAFDRYSFSLLDFVAARDMAEYVIQIEDYAAPLIRPRTEHDPYSALLRVGLGYCAAYCMDVPVDWALAWAESNAAYRQRTPARRCREEFKELFAIGYRQAIPGGLRLKPTLKMINFSYQPASASFGQLVRVQTYVQDAASFEHIGSTLKDIAITCQNELDPYSRYLGRHSEARNSIAAIALLPEPVFEAYTDRILPNLWSWLHETLQDDFAVITVRELIEKFGVERSEASLNKDLVRLSEFLKRLGVAIEPDARFGQRVQQADDQIVLFRLDSEAPPSLSGQYSAASAALSLAVAVVGGKRTIGLEQDNFLERSLVEGFDLSGGEKLRLRARMLLLFQRRVDLKRLRKETARLPLRQREAIGRFLGGVVRNSVQIGPPEMDGLLNSFRFQGLDSEAALSVVYGHAIAPIRVMTPDHVFPAPRFTVFNSAARSIPPDFWYRPSKSGSIDLGKRTCIGITAEHFRRRRMPRVSPYNRPKKCVRAGRPTFAISGTSPKRKNVEPSRFKEGRR